jgi:dienelactone hydrolase
MALGLGAVVLALGACGDGGVETGDDDDNDSVDAGVVIETDARPGGGDGDAGSSPDAGPAGDVGQSGPFDVHLDDGVSVPIDTGSATLTICSPSSDGGGTPADGPFPLVISSPGFQLPRTQYASMCSHLASWGFVVLSQDYAGDGGILNPPNHQTLAEEVGTLIDWATSGASGIAGRLDSTKIAVVGHSLGGKVSILAAILDARIGAVVGWDPVDAKPPIDNGSPSVTPELMSGLTVPIAVVGETLDAAGGFSQCAPADDNYAQYFETACQSADALEVTVDGADHMDWVDDRSSCGFTCSACQTGAADDAATREITRRLTTAWLRKHLLGASGMETFLAAPGIGAGATVRSGPSCS